jgi:hypothetical protein
MTYSVPPPAPPIPAGAVKPSRGWFVVAGAIALVLAIAGVVLGTVGFVAFVAKFPATTARFDSATPFRGDLTGGQDYSVYVATANGRPTLPATRCTGRTGDGAAVALESTTIGNTYDEYGDWTQIYAFSPESTGTYEVTCNPADDTKVGRYAIGKAADDGALATRLLGGVGALFGLPCLGVVVGGVLALVVAVRRSSHRRQLQQQAVHGYGYWPPAMDFNSKES